MLNERPHSRESHEHLCCHRSPKAIIKECIWRDIYAARGINQVIFQFGGRSMLEKEGSQSGDFKDAPQASRPIMPDGYGVPQNIKGLLPWSFVQERMEEARNYWIASVNPKGRPHAVPVWGVWLDEKLYFDGAPDTRHMRNIAANPAVAVHLESGDQVVIIEGEAGAAGKPERSLAERLAAAYSRKYAASGYSPSADSWDEGGLYVVEPSKAFAWTKFPDDTTRWQISR
jgi:hypothetical protein